ncbi:MAG: GTPase Era [Clostridiales bacterium]|nr:GTPase Era [Clostridiales bacterium]
MKSGFVAILGMPNVGKSTLLNCILKEKVSIVSPKPQTTRNKILGIYNDEDSQIVFIDTPGIHNSHNKLDEYMDKAIITAKEDVDVLLFVIDGKKKITDNIIDTLNKYTKNIKNIILVVNKIDDTTYEKLYPELAKCNNLENVKDIVPVSALKGKNITELLKVIKGYLSDDVKYFDDDIYTDKPLKFLVSEIIREKALWLLQDELPHGIAIEIVRFSEGDLYEIDADIILEKPSHKLIVIGKNGSMLKNIGIKSRIDIEKLVGHKVMLKLFVKVREDWRVNSNTVKSLGYNPNDL